MRYLIIDDHSFTRLGIGRILLDDDGDSQIEEVGNAQEALQRLHQQRFDMILLDLSLPDAHGLTLLKDLRARYPETPVLVITMHNQPQYAVRALQAGAAGYLTKDRAPEELTQAVERIRQAKVYLPEDMAGKMWDSLVDGRDPLSLLSDREFQVLRGLAEGHTVTKLAQQFQLSVKTVSTYRSRLMEKLHITSRAEMVALASSIS